MYAILCILSFCTNKILFSTTKIFNENGYSYQCDVDIAKGVTLYNKENQLTYAKWLFKDTGKEPPFPYNINDVKDDTWTKRKCYSIVNNAFSVAEKERTKGRELDICIYRFRNRKSNRSQFLLHNSESFRYNTCICLSQNRIRTKKEYLVCSNYRRKKNEFPCTYVESGDRSYFNCRLKYT